MLYNGLVIDNTYQIVQEIGSGGMGVIFLAFHLRLQKYVVMKKLKNAVNNIHLLRNEVDILKGLHHLYLPQVYDFIEYCGDLFTVIDYIEGYDLKYYLACGYTFSENQLIKWLRQLSEVIDYLHSHTPQILHTDIKPANIIITASGDVCLIDFGISLSGSEHLKGVSMTYSSPEQYLNSVYINYGQRDMCLPIDGRTDIYSLGATFYHLMTRVKPDPANPPPRLTEYSLPYSDALVHIVDKAMAYDINQRYSDAKALNRAVYNIYKVESGYRTDIVLQLLSSLLAGIMIVSGVMLIFSDLKAGKQKDFDNDYSAFVATLNEGDYSTAIQQGRDIINNNSYNELLGTEEKAEIFHSMGDCYYYDCSYINALDNYKLAYNYALNLDDAEVYYRDYAIALIIVGKTLEAREVLNALNEKYPQSASAYIITGRLALKTGDTNSASADALRAVEIADDNESRFAAYELKGDVSVALGNYPSAIDEYSNARMAQETAQIIRKQGAVALRFQDNEQNRDSVLLAKGCFEELFARYAYTENDAFNLCQCCLMLGDHNTLKRGIEVSEAYRARYGETCMMDIITALLYYADSDDRAQEFAIKAHNKYIELTEVEKASIDTATIQQIRNLYEKCTGEVW